MADFDSAYRENKIQHNQNEMGRVGFEPTTPAMSRLSGDDDSIKDGVVRCFKSNPRPTISLGISPFLTSKGISKSVNVLIFFFMLNLNQYWYPLETWIFPQSHSNSVLVKSADLNVPLPCSSVTKPLILSYYIGILPLSYYPGGAGCNHALQFKEMLGSKLSENERNTIEHALEFLSTRQSTLSVK